MPDVQSLPGGEIRIVGGNDLNREEWKDAKKKEEFSLRLLFGHP
jgi:hypothetical protein